MLFYNHYEKNEPYVLSKIMDGLNLCKMVVLKYMHTRGAANWYKSVTTLEVAPFFHDYLMEKPYRRDADLADKQGHLHDYNEAKIAKIIENMPMTKWSGASKGLVQYEDGIFIPQLNDCHTPVSSQ